jgi:hypothetical protein
MAYVTSLGKIICEIKAAGNELKILNFREIGVHFNSIG